MKQFIFFNGKFIELNKAKISVYANSLHYGTAVFEGIRSYKTSKGTAVFRLKEHLIRLNKSAEFMHYKIPYSINELIFFVKELLKKNNLSNAYIRPIVFFEENCIQLHKSNEFKTNIALIAFPMKGFFAGKESTGIKLMVSSLKRIPFNAELFEAKVSGNYALSFLARTEAKLNNFDDAVLLNEKKQVMECSAENIFYIKKGKVFTPKIKGILPGITRKTVEELCSKLKISFKEKTVSLKELMNADELFITGTASGIIKVNQLQKKKFKLNEDSISNKLINEFNSAINAEKKDYLKWLEFI
ncbi:MAG: branched-chain amino acid transaminase [Candidatus Diapherotrites archaeon]|nr:branched-chain amino acid transaminase [Candidatus Diapherotrites archaeon]